MPALHKMTKLEVVLEAEHLPMLQGLMKRAGIAGHTLVRDVAGMGHHGPHAGRITYDDLGSFVMVITVGPEAQIDAVVDGLGPFFATSSGVLFVSEVAVLRADYFAAS